MSTPARPRRLAIAAAVVVAVVAVAVLLVRADRGAHPSAPGRDPASAASAPAVAAVETGDAGPALRANPPAPADPVLLVLESETRKPVAAARWRIGGRGGPARFEGTTGPDGRSPLSEEALAVWSTDGLDAWGGDRRLKSFWKAPPLREGVVEVLLDRFHVDFEGLVIDEAGRPVADAQVVVEYWSSLDSGSVDDADLFRTTSDAEGRFRRSAKVWHPDTDLIDGHVLWVGGPGWIPVGLRPDKRGQKDLVVRLERDREFGTLEIEATEADGAPARGASVWLGTMPDGKAEDARQAFAQLWREPDDPRTPGTRQTWAAIGRERRPAWHHVLGEGGRRVVHGVPARRTRVQALGRGSADVWVDVLPPPAVTRLVLRLERPRTVQGLVRVARDERWPCRHATHEHRVEIEDWAEREWIAPFPSGPLVIEGVPHSATSLRLTTWGRHPEVVVPLPPAGADGRTDVGVVEVPSARELSGTLVWPEGRRPEPWSGLRLEDDDGLVAETTSYWTTDGGPHFDFVTTRPPGAGTRILVRLRPSDGEASKVVRLDGPFDFEGTPRLRLRLPPDTEGRADGQ